MAGRTRKTSNLISHGTVLLNRRARHDYFIEDTLEAGIVLTGTEVKSLRMGRGNIADAHAGPKNGEIYLLNMEIQEWIGGNRFNHEPRRPRKLLLHKQEMKRILGRVKTEGITVVPLKLFFNSRGIAKVELGIARGKKQYEKRESIKQRDWQREKERLMRDK